MATLDTGNPARAVIVDDSLALAENIAEILILEGLPSEVFGRSWTSSTVTGSCGE
jgi:hypothetical protein